MTSKNIEGSDFFSEYEINQIVSALSNEGEDDPDRKRHSGIIKRKAEAGRNPSIEIKLETDAPGPCSLVISRERTAGFIPTINYKLTVSENGTEIIRPEKFSVPEDDLLNCRSSIGFDRMLNEVSRVMRRGESSLVENEQAQGALGSIISLGSALKRNKKDVTDIRTSGTHSSLLQLTLDERARFLEIINKFCERDVFKKAISQGKIKIHGRDPNAPPCGVVSMWAERDFQAFTINLTKQMLSDEHRTGSRAQEPKFVLRCSNENFNTVIANPDAAGRVFYNALAELENILERHYGGNIVTDVFADRHAEEEPATAQAACGHDNTVWIFTR